MLVLSSGSKFFEVGLSTLFFGPTVVFYFELNERTSLRSFAFFFSVDRHLQHLEWIVIAIYIKDLKAWSVAHRPISKQIARLNTL